MNLARLNHILIPERKEDRARAQRSVAGRLLAPAFWLATSLSEEGRVLLGLSLIVGMAGLDVQKTQVYLLWSVLTAMLVASLIARAFMRIKSARLEVFAPDRVAVGEAAQFEVTVVNEGDEPLASLRISRPFLPWDGRWSGPRVRVSVVEPGRRTTVLTTARFRARGEHHLDDFGASALVPLGLAVGPAIYGDGPRFLVVPRVCPIDALTFPPRPFGPLGGEAERAQRGEAQELVGVRPYRIGDPIRDLHARTWARAGIPYVREYQDETYTRFAVVLDCAATLAQERAFEAAVSLVAGVIAFLRKGDALVDLVVLGDGAGRTTYGPGHLSFDQALDRLAAVEPRVKDLVDVDQALAELGEALESSAGFVLVTLRGQDAYERAIGQVHEHGVPGRVLKPVSVVEESGRDVPVVDIESGRGLVL